MIGIGPRWFLFNDDCNVFHASAKAPWDAAQRVLDQKFEFNNWQHSLSSYRQDLDFLVTAWQRGAGR